MRTVYDLLHRSNPNRGFTDKHGTYPTMLEAARQVANPQQWQASPNPGRWYIDTDPPNEWLIVERQEAETDTERVQLTLDLLAADGQVEGSHHQAWVIDQAARILTGDGYEQWIREYRDGEDGPETYSWDEGIAP
jgi:hypothetical protein